MLIQASALLSALMAADKIDRAGKSVTSPRDRYTKEMEPLVRRLTLVSVAPPTSRNYDAQIMLGRLASYAFEPMREQLESQLRYSPMSFRVWRAITKLVGLERGKQARVAEGLGPRLIGDAEELRKLSLYAGRSLDLELAITVPAAWSPPGDDWVRQALRDRARDSEATIRERGTAAMGLWQRALTEKRPDLAEPRRTARPDHRVPRSRVPAGRAAGLRWVAATLEQAIDDRAVVCNGGPTSTSPGSGMFTRRPTNSTSPAFRPSPPGTKNLFRT